MAHQIGARSMGIVPLMQSWINLCCAQSLVLPYNGSYDFPQFSDAQNILKIIKRKLDKSSHNSGVISAFSSW